MTTHAPGPFPPGGKSGVRFNIPQDDLQVFTLHNYNFDHPPLSAAPGRVTVGKEILVSLLSWQP